MPAKRKDVVNDKQKAAKSAEKAAKGRKSVPGSEAKLGQIDALSQSNTKTAEIETRLVLRIRDPVLF
jgi:hypothetical protein